MDWDRDNDGSLDIYETNWNSPNPRLGDGNPGHFFGNEFSDFVQIQTAEIFGKEIPVGATLGFADRPEPSTPTPFVDALAQILNTEYDDDDFVVLIGHSLGGNSVLRVSQQTTTQIDLLASLDPVGWSLTGTADPLLNTQIIPPIVVDSPFSGVIGPDDFRVYDGLNVGIPIDPLVAAATAGLFDPTINPDTNLPRGQIGYRNELPDPSSRVEYFYNRWQQEYFFPFDFLSSGRLDDGAVQNTVTRFRYDGRTIDEQGLSDTNRDVNHDPIERNSDLVDILFNNFGVSLDVDADWGSITDFNFPPDVSVDLNLGRTAAQTHASLPVDPYIQAELKAILDAITPQPPTAVASVVPIGRPFREGDVITLSSAGSFDPNPDDTISFFWRQTAGHAVVISDPNAANPTFYASDDTFNDDSSLVFELTVTDNTGASDTASVTVEIQNVAPIVSPIMGPDQHVRGFDLNFSVAITDPGTADTAFISWDFGDGTVTPFTSIGGSSGTATSPAHAYQGTGTFTVTARVRDDDDTTSVSKTVEIAAAGLIPDPENPSKTALAVGGTLADDEIILSAGGTPGRIDVTINGVYEGSFTPDDRILNCRPARRRPCRDRPGR